MCPEFPEGRDYHRDGYISFLHYTLEAKGLSEKDPTFIAAFGHQKNLGKVVFTEKFGEDMVKDVRVTKYPETYGSRGLNRSDVLLGGPAQKRHAPTMSVVNMTLDQVSPKQRWFSEAKS